MLVSLDQITSSLSHQLTQVENKSNKLESLLDEDLLADLVEKNATYSEKVFYCKSKLDAVNYRPIVLERVVRKDLVDCFSDQMTSPMRLKGQPHWAGAHST